MKEFFRQHGLRILAAAAAVAVLLSVLTYFSSTSSVLENIAGVLTSPFRAAATAVSDCDLIYIEVFRANLAQYALFAFGEVHPRVHAFQVAHSVDESARYALRFHIEFANSLRVRIGIRHVVGGKLYGKHELRALFDVLVCVDVQIGIDVGRVESFFEQKTRQSESARRRSVVIKSSAVRHDARI